MSTAAAGYLRASKTPWYSLLSILPLAALYEALALLVNWDSAAELRNGADVLLRQTLALFGLNTPYLLGALLAAAIAAAWLWQRRASGSSRVSGTYLLLMLAESLLWGGFLLISLSVADQLLMLPTSDQVLRTAFLAVGAGIYEEGVFRLLLVSALGTFFRRALDWQRPIAWGLAVTVAAVLFALFHYVGPAGELFGWNSFGYRCVAGVILGLLFIFRGFGITVYAHTFYNLMVLGITTVN